MVKYITVTLLIALFLSDVLFSFTLIFIKDSKNQAEIICLIDGLENETTEKESKESKETLKESKLKEGVLHLGIYFGSLPSGIRVFRRGAAENIVRLYYSRVPTPPPDFV